MTTKLDQRRSPISCIVFTTALTTLGCSSAANPAAEHIAEQQSSIVGGNSTSSGTATAIGVVRTQHQPMFTGQSPVQSDNCSAELLRNDIIITARHCVTKDGTPTGTVDTTVSDFTIFMDGQTVQAAAILDPTNGSYDFAYIVVTPFLLTSGFPGTQAYGWALYNSVYPGTDASLVGSALTCYGYGNNTCAGTGFGTLRSAGLSVVASTTTSITFGPNSSGQIQWTGDSGSTCFLTDGQWSFVTSKTTVAGCPENVIGTGPQVLTTYLNNYFAAFGTSLSTTSTSSNVSGDSMVLNYFASNGNSAAKLMITPNYNPPGQSGEYLDHNIGVWYNGSEWEIFNQDTASMPTGESFNVTSAGEAAFVGKCTGCQGGTASGDSMSTGWTGANSMVFVTPVYNPPGGTSTYNNHATGVWFNGSQWLVFNEDETTMPSTASFVTRVAEAEDTAYVHQATTSNTSGDSTFLNNPNLNGQPGATVFVTHNWNPGGSGGTYNNHPIGVWYNGSQWAVFNEDEAAMPTNVAFNVLIIPANNPL
jgi:hypothetical protein